MTAWGRFTRNRLAVVGLALIVVLALSAMLAPWLAPYDPARQSLIEKRATPGAKYWLGADEFGRDILSRVIYGSRVALLVGVLSVLIALVGELACGLCVESVSGLESHTRDLGGAGKTSKSPSPWSGAELSRLPDPRK